MVTAPMRMLDPDEAVTGLMARRIARGTNYAYFAGQHYLGTLEQYLQAPIAAVAPRNSFLLRLPQVALSGLACWLVYLVGRRMLDGPRAAAAAWLFAAGPAFNLVYGVKTRGAYVSAVVVGLLGLLVALRHEPGRGERRTAALFGLLCGLGAWLSLLTALLLAPAAVWLVGGRWRRPRAAVATALAGGLVGAAPALAAWLAGGPLVGLGGVPVASGPLQRLRGLLDPVLAEFLGLAWRRGDPVLPHPLALAVLVALAAAWVVAVVRRRRGLLALLPGVRGRRKPCDLLLVTVPIAVLLYASSRYAWYTDEPRYLFVLYPLLALGVAALLPAHGRLAAAVSAVLVVAVAAVAVGTLAARTPPDLRPGLARLAGVLDATGATALYADYQLAYPFDYYQGRRVVAVPYGDNSARFPDLAGRAAASDTFAYAMLDVDAPSMTRLLGRYRVRYVRHDLGGLVALTDLRPPLRPRTLRLNR